jgi:outer membrane biosynthesis protein TonB
MPVHMHNPYEAPESSSSNRLYLDLLLLSLLAHAALLTVILLVAAFMPMPDVMLHKPPPPATVSLSLMQPPAKPIFIPTSPDANAKHKLQQVESANDTDLKSKSKTARNPNSIMPDIDGKEHNPDLNNSPNIKSPQKPEVSSTPPTPKVAKPEKPTPPQPQPQHAPPTPPKPPQPAPKPAPPTPPQKPQPQVDANGFPILPPLNAPTLAPPDSAAQPLAPASSQAQQVTSIHGALGMQGANSPAAMATELGKYKQYVYSVVGSYWYPDVDQHFGTIGVGMVHIQFTIHSDGRISDVIVLEGNNGNTEILKGISHHALIAPAPYKPFSDALIKEVGDSYTDDFTFSVY